MFTTRLLLMVSASASPSLSDIEMAFTPFPPIEAASAAGGAPAPPPPPTKNHFVSQTLGNNMVLQRAPAQAVLWGFAGIGGTVTVTMDSAPPLAAVTDAQGFWRATLPATEASNDPHTFSIRSSNGTSATLSNVLFGDVYICGGQSNMAFSLPANTNSAEEVAKGVNYTTIRVMTIGTYVPPASTAIRGAFGSGALTIRSSIRLVRRCTF